MKVIEKVKLQMINNRKITSGTKEWADHNVNCILGCYNNCRYCYAKIMAKRFGRGTEETWKNMKIREDAITKTYKKMQGVVMFPSTHDIFDFSPFKEACFTVLEKLLETGNNVLITSKPRLSAIREIMLKFEKYKDNIQFRFTITSIDDDLLKFWEPNAPSFKERLTALKCAWTMGFKTSVSIEPFLDYNPTKLIQTVLPFVTDSIWIGKMNYIRQKQANIEEKLFYDDVRKNYDIKHLQLLHHKLSEYPKVRFKDSIVLELARTTFFRFNQADFLNVYK
jgi:DNA repair photolyase